MDFPVVESILAVLSSSTLMVVLNLYGALRVSNARHHHRFNLEDLRRMASAARVATATGGADTAGPAAARTVGRLLEDSWKSRPVPARAAQG